MLTLSISRSKRHVNESLELAHLAYTELSYTELSESFETSHSWGSWGWLGWGHSVPTSAIVR